MPLIIILSGVAGSGKTTVGKTLSALTGGSFHDADDYHSPENVEKMRKGIPLDDADRDGWLERLARLIAKLAKEDKPAFLACSALKKVYRDRLQDASPGNVEFVFLHGSREVIRQRMRERSDHFVTESLLDSQFETLEPPEHSFTVDISRPVRDITAEIVRHFTGLQDQ